MSNQRRAELIGLPRDVLAGRLLAAIAIPEQLATARLAGLSPEAVQAIANAPDAWSAAMLVKFGPPGSLWATGEPETPQNPDGLSLLAQRANHVYEQ